MKEETSKEQMIAWTEQEFVNVIKMRKVVQNTMKHADDGQNSQIASSLLQ